MAIIIQTTKQEIPIEFGEVQLAFAVNDEALVRLAELQNYDSSRIKDMQEQFNRLKAEDLKGADLVAMVNEASKEMRQLFDQLLGEGAYQRVYEIYPSIFTIMDGFIQILEQLPDEIEAYNEKKENEQTARIEKYRKKK